MPVYLLNLLSLGRGIFTQHSGAPALLLMLSHFIELAQGVHRAGTSAFLKDARYTS